LADFDDLDDWSDHAGKHTHDRYMIAFHANGHVG